MGAVVEPVEEQAGHVRSAEFARRQADVVDHQEGNRHAGGAGIAIGRREEAHTRRGRQPPVSIKL
ncbi:hypothetical protein BPNSA17_10320 [Bordetella petrii]